MLIRKLFESSISSPPRSVAARRPRSRSRLLKRRSYRPAMEALESRQLMTLNVPELSSFPGALQTLYLDFDGSDPFLWDGARSGDPYVVRGPSPDDAPIPVPAFDTDGDPDHFSDFPGTEDDEIGQIKLIHALVAEKFSPFSINVTTVAPGVVQDSRNMTALIGGSDRDWYAPEIPAGGVAAIGGFVDGGPNTFFVFSGDNGNPRFIGETVAHEAGHAIGLEHQRQYISADETNEYYFGDAIRAPIMGASSINPNARGIWWLTNNPAWPGQNSPDAVQDDLIALTQDAPQRLFYRNDDFTHLNIPDMQFDGVGALVQQRGIIERNGDVDGFRFRATSTSASFKIKNAPFGGMLAPSASIRIGGTNTPIDFNLSVNNTEATISANNLTPGRNYVLLVSGQGQYGDLGQYTIDGSMLQFARFNAATGIVTVNGFVGNNNVTLKTGSNNTLLVEVSVNGGPTARRSFPMGAVTSVDVILAGGDDTLNVPSLVRADGSTVEVASSLGGGFDTLRLGATGNNFSTFNVGLSSFAWTPVNSGTSRVSDTGSERVELIGTQSRDVFNFNSQPQVGTIHVFGNGGDDLVYLGRQVMAAHRPVVIFDGGGGTDTLEMDGSILADPQHFVVSDNKVQRFLPGVLLGVETHFGTAVETLRIRSGSGQDTFSVHGLRAGMTAFLSGGDGADEFRVGDSANPILPLPFSANVRGIVNVSAGSGNDRLVVDDAAWGSVGNYTIDSFGVKNAFVKNWVQYDSTLDRVDFHSRSGGTTRLTTPLTSQEFHLFNGPGNGLGTLIVDDRSGLSGPVNMSLHPDRIVRNFTIGAPRAIHYEGYESLTLYTNAGTNAIDVFGTSPDITHQTTIRAGDRHDVVTLYPHGADGASAATIVSPLGFFGGAGQDTFRVDDRASAAPLDYLFNNAGGASTANIFGLGPAAVGAFNDVETIDVLAGAGDDTFTVSTNTLKKGTVLQIGGGDGNDTYFVNAAAAGATTTLLGGDGNDGFIVGDGPGLGGIAGRLRLDGQTGDGGGYARFSDSVSATARKYIWGGNSLRWGNVIVDVSNLGLTQLIGGQANDTYRLSALGPIPLALGDGGGIDRLTGPDTATHWRLTGADSGDLGPAVSFAAIENLVGGSADDTFAIANNASLSGTLAGGGGVNTLDYSGTSVANPQFLSGPVSQYRGEGSAADSAGGNHGAIEGDVAFVPGQVGQAFDFDGDLDYVDLGSDASLDLPGSMSVSMWVRLETLDRFKYFLADFYPATGNTTQGSLGTAADASTFAWAQSYTDGTFETLSGLTPIQLNQWFHLAVVRDDDAKTARLYVNGVEESSLGYAGKTVVSLQGSKLLGGSGVDFPGDFMDGQLDEVGIYSRALNPTEIETLAEANGVVVNLRLGTASKLTGGIRRIQNVIGSSGNDILVGNGGNVLSGGAGRDLLIAGALASILEGGDDDDLLIGGRTNYDASASALSAILAEWTRDSDYATRVANLNNGAGGAPILNANTVRSNGGGNTLHGEAGLDYFFSNMIEDTLDWDPLTEDSFGI